MSALRVPVPGGFGFPLGFLAAVLVTSAMVAGGGTAHPLWSLLALCAVAGALACVTTAPAAAATSAVAWGLHAGFVLGRHGDLALTPAAARDAFVLVAVTLATFTAAAAVRTVKASLGGVRRGRTRETVAGPAQGWPHAAAPT